MRKLLFLVGVLGLSCASLAQANQAAWTNLSALHPGQSIEVTDTAAKMHPGTFLSVSDTAISFSETSGEKSIPKQDVRSVKLMANKHRLRNTVIGAGVGAGAGAGIVAGTWESGGFLGGKGVGAAVGAVIGGISGAIVGALLPSHSTIYRAASH
jgi:uncharacterized protein YcfJ